MVLCPTKRLNQLALTLCLVSLLVFSSVSVGAHPEPQARKPYMAEHQQVGMIGCSAAYQVIHGRDFCETLDPNSKSAFDFPLDAHLTTMVLQVESRGGVVAADAFSVAVYKPVGIHGLHGSLPLLGTWSFDEETAWPSWGNPDQTLTLDVRPDNRDPVPQVSYQQVFDVCVGLFYNGAEVPEGYSPCASA